jgi:glycolate oxidase iron-sulfur subunit
MTISSSERVGTPAPGYRQRNGPSIEDLTRCVQCGLCLGACPTFAETRSELESPRGRLYLMRALGEGRIEPTDAVAEHLELCLGCRACEAACPSGVRFGHLMEASRHELLVRRPPTLGARLLRWLALEWLFESPSRLRLVARLLRAYQRAGLSRSVQPLVPPRLREAERLMPRLSARPFDPREVRPRERGEPTALFVGCMMPLAFAEAHRATVRTLEQTGRSVCAPAGQGCCGALQLHAGERELAENLARRNVEAFEASGEAEIVVNAAGCGALLKEYGELLEHDPMFAERAARLARRVRDLSEVLADRAAAPRLDTGRRLRVAYQDACHLAQAQRIKRQPREVLRSLPGVELVELREADLCCGSAGVYNLVQPDMAGRLLERKVEAIRAARPELVVSANPGCIIQIRAGLEEAGLPIPVLHLAELVDRLSAVTA